ncbi:Arginase family protein [Candidatus Tiddalikarchaeum anstoanum]|nr:Arginase family protein [Candidatus Tiddalikarchaeum anstoanum]
MDLNLLRNDRISLKMHEELLNLDVIDNVSEAKQPYYLGSGKNHYLTDKIIDSIEPVDNFTLLVYDAHIDYTEDEVVKSMDTHFHYKPDKFMTCGNWIYSTIKKHPDCNVLIVGPDSTVIDVPALTVLSPDEAGYVLVASRQPVYVSVDLDVLNTKLSLEMGEWNTGKMNLESLLNSIRFLAKNNNIIGFDVCGHSMHSLDVDFNTLCITARVLNAYTNKVKDEDLINSLNASRKKARLYSMVYNLFSNVIHAVMQCDSSYWLADD